MSEIRKISWKRIEPERLNDFLLRQTIHGEKGTLAQFFVRVGGGAQRHIHVNEEYVIVNSGALKFCFDDHEVVVNAGDVLVIPANVPHSVAALEDAVFFEFWAPLREDWLRGEDQYLRA